MHPSAKLENMIVSKDYFVWMSNGTTIFSELPESLRKLFLWLKHVSVEPFYSLQYKTSLVNYNIFCKRDEYYFPR